MPGKGACHHDAHWHEQRLLAFMTRAITGRPGTQDWVSRKRPRVTGSAAAFLRSCCFRLRSCWHHGSGAGSHCLAWQRTRESHSPRYRHSERPLSRRVDWASTCGGSERAACHLPGQASGGALAAARQLRPCQSMPAWRYCTHPTLCLHPR